MLPDEGKKAINQVLSPIYEKQFSPGSYRFIPKAFPGRRVSQTLTDYLKTMEMYTNPRAEFEHYCNCKIQSLGICEYQKEYLRVANSPILIRSITNDRLQQAGYIFFTDYNRMKVKIR